MLGDLSKGDSLPPGPGHNILKGLGVGWWILPHNQLNLRGVEQQDKVAGDRGVKNPAVGVDDFTALVWQREFGEHGKTSDV